MRARSATTTRKRVRNLLTGSAAPLLRALGSLAARAARRLPRSSLRLGGLHPSLDSFPPERDLLQPMPTTLSPQPHRAGRHRAGGAAHPDLQRAQDVAGLCTACQGRRPHDPRLLFARPPTRKVAIALVARPGPAGQSCHPQRRRGHRQSRMPPSPRSTAEPLKDTYRLLVLDGVALRRQPAPARWPWPVLVALGLRPDGK